MTLTEKYSSDAVRNKKAQAFDKIQAEAGQKQLAKHVADVVGKQAYDKGRYDTEVSLASMLYDQVLAPEAATMTPQEAAMLDMQAETGQSNFQELAPTAEELGLAGALR